MTAQTTDAPSELASVVPIKSTPTLAIAEEGHRVHGRILDTVTALVTCPDGQAGWSLAAIRAAGVPSDPETRNVMTAAFLVARLLDLVAQDAALFWATFADADREHMAAALGYGLVLAERDEAVEVTA